MEITDLVIPIVSSDWNERELGFDKGTLDGYSDFFADIDPETNMPILISNNNDSYELGLIRISFPFLIFIYVYFP